MKTGMKVGSRRSDNRVNKYAGAKDCSAENYGYIRDSNIMRLYMILDLPVVGSTIDMDVNGTTIPVEVIAYSGRMLDVRDRRGNNRIAVMDDVKGTWRSVYLSPEVHRGTKNS